jgi:hypothetical protein
LLLAERAPIIENGSRHRLKRSRRFMMKRRLRGGAVIAENQCVCASMWVLQRLGRYEEL